MKKFLLTALAGAAIAASAQAAPLEVRMAEIKVKPDMLETFLSAVKENMRDSVATEPGVISIYAVADKNDPAALTFFEIYADAQAYQHHIQTPHFKRYIERTRDLTDDKKLIPVDIVELQPVPVRH